MVSIDWRLRVYGVSSTMVRRRFAEVATADSYYRSFCLHAVQASYETGGIEWRKGGFQAGQDVLDRSSVPKRGDRRYAFSRVPSSRGRGG
jgi:hypothetical protein